MANNETPASRTAKPVWRRFLPLGVVAAGLARAMRPACRTICRSRRWPNSVTHSRPFVAENRVGIRHRLFVAYALAVAFSFPAASILTIFAGFLFGWLLGGALTAIAATTGAAAVFLAAKSAFGDVLRKRAGPFAAKLADGFSRDAFGYLFVLRLAPVFPFLS
jgi:uncharacterized membrane protein YdjX (TVP38/TMEM64 family)